MKKIPMRKCTGCGEMKPKRELIRVVKAPDVKDENGNAVESGGVSLDLTGKKSGRGAYVCKSADCFEKGVAAHDHLRCTACGKLSNISLPWLSNKLRQSVGTEIAGYDLTIRYLCPECRKKA